MRKYLSSATCNGVSQVVACSAGRCPLPSIHPDLLLRNGMTKNQEKKKKIMELKCLEPKKKKNLPYNKEGITINVPRLNLIFPILEDDLDEFVEVGVHDGGLKVGASPSGIGRDASEVEDSGNLEVVSELYRSVRRDIGDAVDGVPLLAVDQTVRVCEHDRTAWLDCTVVVRALRVRPRSTSR